MRGFSILSGNKDPSSPVNNKLFLLYLHFVDKAVLSRLSKDAEIFDNEELQCHQKLQDLYRSTRETKHFQKDIVRGVEGFVSIGQKEKQIAKKLAEDCHKYGTENVNADFPLTRAAVELGTSYTSIEDKRETMLEIFNNQVSEPLRASIRCAPLEDARHLARSCDRLRQEVETQAVEVLRRQTKFRDPTPESAMKLRNMETRLSDLRTSMVTLQKEAISAMLSVEEQQQQVTLQKLILMVDAERCYHRQVVAILEELHTEMILEMKLQESSQSAYEKDNLVPSGDATQHEHDNHQTENQEHDYFIGKVIHPFDAQADGELSLIVDDYVIVRKDGRTADDAQLIFPSQQGTDLEKKRKFMMLQKAALHLWMHMALPVALASSNGTGITSDSLVEEQTELHSSEAMVAAVNTF